MTGDGGTRDGRSTVIAGVFFFFVIIFVPYTSDGALGPPWEDSFGPCALRVDVREKIR